MGFLWFICLSQRGSSFLWGIFTYVYIKFIYIYISKLYIYIYIIYNNTYLRINMGYTFKIYCTHPSRICFSQIRDLTRAQGPIRGPDRRKQQWCTYTPAWMSNRKLGSIVRINGFISATYTLEFLLGVFHPLILTIDPNFRLDI